MITLNWVDHGPNAFLAIRYDKGEHHWSNAVAVSKKFSLDDATDIINQITTALKSQVWMSVVDRELFTSTIQAELLTKTTPAKAVAKSTPKTKPSVTDPSSVADTITHINEKVKNPVDGSVATIKDTIISLNDAHKWPREAIAAWLDTLPVVPTFEPMKETLSES